MCAVVCGIVFLMGFMQGFAILQKLRMAISLATVAVPEKLPAAATLNFALGIKRMQRHGVLIRKLQAVETLGLYRPFAWIKQGPYAKPNDGAENLLRPFVCQCRSETT